MCLEIVDKETKQIKYGWKVFRNMNGKLKSICRGNGKHFKKGVWHNEKDFRGEEERRKTIDSHFDGRYKKGFHVFVTLKGLKFWRDYKDDIIKKVEVKDIVASGTQLREDVVVVKKLKVVE